MANRKFEKAKKLVTKILEDYPQTRNSDNLLYIKVIDSIGTGNSDKSIREILLNLEELGLPCFETVRRSRAKIQAEREDLRASDVVQDFRTQQEEEYREFFTNAR